MGFVLVLSVMVGSGWIENVKVVGVCVVVLVCYGVCNCDGCNVL